MNDEQSINEEKQGKYDLQGEIEARIFEIHTTRLIAMSKYTYFLLAAVGAAIGLTLKVTVESRIDWSQFPLLLALVFWGASFYSGCRAITIDDKLSGAAGLFLFYIAQSLRSSEKIDMSGENEHSKSATRLAKDALLLRNAQFKYLSLGAIWFITWHIGEMILRTVR